jgi:penicillin amidase
MGAQLNGSFSIEGLRGNAKLWRDKWGIPHIHATNSWDVFVVLGFAHSQDRLWQMDMQRRRAVGRWAEWAGPSAVEQDRLARRMGGRQAAERDYAALGTEAREMLDAYAIGVNAFIDKNLLPKEYGFLGEKPEAWEPWNSIAVMRQIGFLMGSVWLKLFRAAALPAIGGEGISKLRYDDGGVDFLCIPPGAERKRADADLLALKPSIDALLGQHAPDLMGGGSNNWVLSGDQTATGRPILMGDPHRELEVPTMYTQAHIACDQFDAIGLTVPGVPGFPHVAHNDRVAWCVTHAFMDIHDLFIEKFCNDGEEALFKDRWEKTVRRTEIIKVREGADAEVEVIETRHGPVIAGDPKQGTALAIRSVQFAQADVSFDCLPKMLRAKSVRELYDSVTEWGLIDHNLVAADIDGHIGHRVRAKVPVRPRENGWLPVPGWTGEHEWRGFVPPKQMPECIDPPGGRIVTANNRIVEDGTGPYLCTDCHPPHRARRIAELLDGFEKPSIDTMSEIYVDVSSRPAHLFQSYLEGYQAKTDRARRILEDLRDWDCRLTPTSTAASVYSLLRVAVTTVVARKSGLSALERLHSNLMTDTGIISHLWWVIPSLLRDEDATLLGTSNWELVFDEAMEIVQVDQAARVWSALHAPTLRHPLASVFPMEAAELNQACAPVGGDNDTVFATGFSAGDGLSTKYSALARTSFDVGQWENSRWIVFQGASGNPGSTHRSDQNEFWATGQTVPMVYSWHEIANTSQLYELRPSEII